MAANGHSEDLTIYYNDSIDSDNSAAALALLREMAQRHPAERAIWILEPRQVAWGLETTNKDMATCQQLLMQYFPGRYQTKIAALKAVLGGLVEKEMIDQLAEENVISPEELALLRKAIRAPYGKRAQAEKHARLMAWDLASCLAEWSKEFHKNSPVPKIEVLIDNDSLSEVQNPVNLNLHHHEELATRTQPEFKEYNQHMKAYKQAAEKYDQLVAGYEKAVAEYERVVAAYEEARQNPGPYQEDMKRTAMIGYNDALAEYSRALGKPDQLPTEYQEALETPNQAFRKLQALERPEKPDPADYLEDWYDGCIQQLESQCNKEVTSVETLNIDSLCETIRTAGRVRFMGGSSLRILRQFIERGVAPKIKCYLQVGSYDLSANLFANQFNIALNLKAARFVFDKYGEFSSFTVVPSATAQSLKFSLVGLERVGHECLGKKMLGFNAKLDPDEIAEGKKTLKDNFPDKSAPMPDLTTFLCVLREKELEEGFEKELGKKFDVERSFVKVNYNEETGVLLFERAAKGIPTYHSRGGEVSVGADEVVKLLDFSDGGD